MTRGNNDRNVKSATLAAIDSEGAMHHDRRDGRRSLLAAITFFWFVFSFFLALLAGDLPAHAQSDLARAYRIIAGKQFVDLTHSFGPDSPVWSGFGQAKMTPAADPKAAEP